MCSWVFERGRERGEEREGHWCQWGGSFVLQWASEANSSSSSGCLCSSRCLTHLHTGALTSSSLSSSPSFLAGLLCYHRAPARRPRQRSQPADGDDNSVRVNTNNLCVCVCVSIHTSRGNGGGKEDNQGRFFTFLPSFLHSFLHTSPNVLHDPHHYQY